MLHCVRFFGGKFCIEAVRLEPLIFWLELENEQSPRNKADDDEGGVNLVGSLPPKILENHCEQRCPAESPNAGERRCDSENFPALLLAKPISQQRRYGQRCDAGHGEAENAAPDIKPLYAITERKHEDCKCE